MGEFPSPGSLLAGHHACCHIISSSGVLSAPSSPSLSPLTLFCNLSEPQCHCWGLPGTVLAKRCQQGEHEKTIRKGAMRSRQVLREWQKVGEGSYLRRLPPALQRSRRATCLVPSLLRKPSSGTHHPRAGRWARPSRAPLCPFLVLGPLLLPLVAFFLQERCMHATKRSL